MKLMHLSDLHLGKRVNEFSMLEDQRHVLYQILQIAEQEKTKGVIIAGDIYDKMVPSSEAVVLLDEFLTSLSRLDQKVFIIGGNHDSQERLSFGGRLLAKQNIFLAPAYEEVTKPICLEDEYGTVAIYLLPFIKPAYVKRVFPSAEIASYDDAFACAVESMQIDHKVRNVLVAHQFVTGAVRSDSEDIAVGGVDGVSADSCMEFDYVALGHIHRPQQMKKETIRYCGTPLKYSFSEVNQEKSVTLVDLKEKGEVTVSTVPLKPLHDMQEIRGTYLEVTARDFYREMDVENYMHVILTDEEDVPDAIGKLRTIYPNVMKLSYDNKRTGMNQSIDAIENVQKKSPLVLFHEFYEIQNNQKMSSEQTAFVKKIMEEIWGEEKL